MLSPISDLRFVPITDIGRRNERGRQLAARLKHINPVSILKTAMAFRERRAPSLAS
jgi:hypothetical protein